MEIIPVLDIMAKKAVSGKSGRREEYRELKTIFAPSSDPIEIARNLPYKRLYCADLDGIVHGEPDYETLEKLAGIKRTMIDAGVRSHEDAERIYKTGGEVVIGTETLDGWDTLKRSLEEFGKKIILSLDIKDGKIISRFLSDAPKDVFESLREAGARKFIFLNISSVGTLSGFEFDFLEDIQIEKGLEVYVAGGIKKTDLGKLKNMGVSGALIGTALHRGLF